VTRALATIRRIDAVAPIPNADTIEVARIGGWNVVVKKGDHQPGDLVVYCEVDSYLPERAEFEFLRKSCFRSAVDGLRAGLRIKTVKLRGQVSQGIVFPLSILGDRPHECGEGDDVTERLDIIKYERPLTPQLRGQAAGYFPSWIPKTDEPRWQNIGAAIDRNRQWQFDCTEKLDGSSMTVAVRGEESFVCSRNVWLKEDDDNAFCNLAREIGVLAAMRDYAAAREWEGLVLQGELIGPGIQGNRYQLTRHEWRIFNVLVYGEGQCKWVTNESVRIHVANLAKNITERFATVPELPGGNIAADLNEHSRGGSILRPEVPREGVVWRCAVPLDDDPDIGRVSFKAINPDFLLKFDE
jgi:RNA ligase (TIGR02306 family)